MKLVTFSDYKFKSKNIKWAVFIVRKIVGIRVLINFKCLPLVQNRRLCEAVRALG